MQLLDIIALTEDLPEHHLQRGHVGTVVEILAPDAFEVEFVGRDGYTYAMAALRTDQLLKLYFNPITE